MSGEIKTKWPWLVPLVGSILFLVLFGLWWGVPTYNKWRGDKFVDKLCDEDGGVKVYKTVTLPAFMFNKYNNPKVKYGFNPSNKDNSNLYFDLKIKNLIGNYDSSSISKLAVWQTKISLVRKSDGKILGEGVWYSRRGGDPFGPWHPSSYTCPENITEWDLAKKIVLKQSDK